MVSGASPTAQLRLKVIRGFGWNMVSSLSNQGSRIVVGVILARLLTPHDYGVAGMAFVFSSLIYAFTDLGLGAGLVQRRDPSETDKATVFWTSAGVGAIVAALGVALAGPIAAFYGEPSVKPLFQVLSLTFLVGALGTTQASLLQREMRFRTITLRSVIGSTTGGVAGILVALAGYGPWALVAQQLTSIAAATSLMWVASGWRPRLTYSRQSLRDLGGFGLNVWAARGLDYGRRNADNLLIGRFLGSSALGTYSVAYNIMLLPVQRLMVPIQDALFPALSRIQDDPHRLASVWLRANRSIVAIVMPAMAGLIVVAPDIVRVILGTRWEAAVRVLQVLAVVAILQSMLGVNAKLLTAMNRTSAVLFNSTLAFGLSIPAFVIGLHWGIVGVAAGYAVANVPVLIAFTIVTTRALGISRRSAIRNLGGVAAATAAMVCAVVALRDALQSNGVGAAPRLAIVILAGMCVYGLASIRTTPELLQEIRQFRRGVAVKRSQAAAS